MTDGYDAMHRVDPSGAHTPAEFAARLRQARIAAGNPSLETMALQSSGSLPRATLSELLKGSRLPKLPQLNALLRVVAVPTNDYRPWIAAWERALEYAQRQPGSHLLIRPPAEDDSQAGVGIRPHVDETFPINGLLPISAPQTDPPEELSVRWSGNEIQSIDIAQRILLWGAPGSGKTCFLAALNAAVANSGRWSLTGEDEASADYLRWATVGLIGERQFPHATFSERLASYILSCDVKVTYRKFLRNQTRIVPLRIRLTVLDPRGGAFLPGDYYGNEDVVDFLMRCDGIIYFHDGTRTLSRGDDSYEYLHNTLAKAERRFQIDSRFEGGRIPHRVSVCVSKFDDPHVFKRAWQGGYLTPAGPGKDRHRVPALEGEAPMQFFRSLCREGDAAFVDYSIRRYFDPGRVQYFATSSVGFYRSDDSIFDWDDCCNRSNKQQENSVRGIVAPLNVLEPILWLQEGLSVPERAGGASISRILQSSG